MEKESGHMTERIKGISGSTLKLIALVSMLIDHTAAVVLERAIIQGGYTETLDQVYYFMRMGIGRLAFPIYCFLLVEGFEKTRNRKRYGGRLFLFAIISEIPFNLAFRGRLLDLSYQNIFFTLFIGLLTIWIMDIIEKKNISYIWKVLGEGLVFLAAIMIAEVSHCDYGGRGIIAIGLLYLFRKNRIHQIIAGAIAFLWELTAPIAFLFVGFYNGQRGIKLKYIFYAFYPLHLLLPYLLSRALFG